MRHKKVDLISSYYNAVDAAKRLSENSGKPIDKNYPRSLARYGKIRTLLISKNSLLYNKEDIDNYVVGKRGRPKKKRYRIVEIVEEETIVQ